MRNKMASRLMRRRPVTRDSVVWRRPSLLGLITWSYLAWSIVPILIAVRLSFNVGPSAGRVNGYSLRWYAEGLTDPRLRAALLQSARLGLLTVLVATPLGVALALGLSRWHGAFARLAGTLVLLCLATPEIALAAALFVVFLYLFTFVRLSTVAQLLGHITFAMSYVVIVLTARLTTMGREYEEIAMDLGASPRQVVRFVLLPLLLPAIIAVGMIAFTLSLNDFVISRFLCIPSDCLTLSVILYNGGGAIDSPSLNAIGTTLMVSSLVAVGLAAGIERWFAHRRGTREGSLRDPPPPGLASR
ncbi:MAG: ABC transporter permease [Actinomycetota bacterium]